MPETEGTLAELGVTAVGPAGLQTVTLNLRHLGTQGCHRPRTLLVHARDRDRETGSHLLPLPPQLGGGQRLGGHWPLQQAYPYYTVAALCDLLFISIICRPGYCEAAE